MSKYGTPDQRRHGHPLGGSRISVKDEAVKAYWNFDLAAYWSAVNAIYAVLGLNVSPAEQQQKLFEVLRGLEVQVAGDAVFNANVVLIWIGIRYAARVCLARIQTCQLNNAAYSFYSHWPIQQAVQQTLEYLAEKKDPYNLPRFRLLLQRFLREGGGRLASSGSFFLDFEMARYYCRGLGLNSEEEWDAWARSEARSPFIPANPAETYKGQFISLSDFLGYLGKDDFLSFEMARYYCRGLGLNSEEEWDAWLKGPERPPFIPANPAETYKGQFVSLSDFLDY